jgi:hypothetical protein
VHVEITREKDPSFVPFLCAVTVVTAEFEAIGNIRSGTPSIFLPALQTPYLSARQRETAIRAIAPGTPEVQSYLLKLALDPGESWNVRTASLERLRYTTNKTLPDQIDYNRLLRLVSDTTADWHVRLAAFDLVFDAQRKPASDTSSLRTLMKRSASTPTLEKQVVDTLVSRDFNVIHFLISNLQSPDWQLRYWSLYGLFQKNRYLPEFESMNHASLDRVRALVDEPRPKSPKSSNRSSGTTSARDRTGNHRYPSYSP